MVGFWGARHLRLEGDPLLIRILIAAPVRHALIHSRYQFSSVLVALCFDELVHRALLHLPKIDYLDVLGRRRLPSATVTFLRTVFIHVVDEPWRRRVFRLGIKIRLRHRHCIHLLALGHETNVFVTDCILDKGLLLQLLHLAIDCPNGFQAVGQDVIFIHFWLNELLARLSILASVLLLRRANRLILMQDNRCQIGLPRRIVHDQNHVLVLIHSLVHPRLLVHILQLISRKSDSLLAFSIDVGRVEEDLHGFAGRRGVLVHGLDSRSVLLEEGSRHWLARIRLCPVGRLHHRVDALCSRFGH